MLILRAGLYVAVGTAALTTWLSAEAGYPIEVAMVRGLLAFMAASLVAYAAELVVLTAPPPARPQHPAALDEYETDDDDDEPVNLPAVRAERDAALDERRAA